jgi:hypothetical protein
VHFKSDGLRHRILSWLAGSEHVLEPPQHVR